MSSLIIQLSLILTRALPERRLGEDVPKPGFGRR
jgi:hypothetical protein